MILPELLSPAGSAPAMVAAVQCGADAVYLGANDFNARRSADNFGGELDAAVGYCHARGAKAYITLNTMVREDEYARLEKTIDEISRAGADGVIVQDIGVARALRQMNGDLALHASTQMAVHNPQGVEFLVKQGFRRVVLAREMTYDEIRRCADLGAELEVFVHGALCVSCSGQCLMSSMIGGRSGNRGMCAQPCRMRYRAGDREGYFLSTKDLCGLDGLKYLIDAGVRSLKIEGRLKRPEYVGEVTHIYRDALTAISAGAPFDPDAAKRDLKQMFNRGGFTKGYGFGVEDAELMYAKRPNHLGVEIGVCRKNGIVIPDVPTDSRDALVLRRGDQDIPVRGGDFSAARRGDRLVRLVSQAQMAAVQARFTGEHKKFPIHGEIDLRIGERARLTLTDGVYTARAEGDSVQPATGRPADPDRIRAQIARLGDTPFVLGELTINADANAFAPASMLNALRREAAERLFAQRMGAGHPAQALAPVQIPDVHCAGVPRILLQSADASVLRAALISGADGAIYAPLDVRAPALQAAERQLPDTFALALPPVLPEGALNRLNEWAMGLSDRISETYITNIGQMQLAWPGESIADYPMNIASRESIAQLAEWHIDTYVPSIELTAAQIANLPENRQLIVHGRIPLMYLRHCPYRAIHGLSGKHASCRRCDTCAIGDRAEDLSLTDRTGAAFSLSRIATDDGCILRLMNCVPLSLLRKSRGLPAASAWRILTDDPAEAPSLIRLYRAAATGKNPKDDPEWAKIESMSGTTGHYFRGVE